MEKLKKINTDKINKWTFMLFAVVIFVVLTLCPEIKHVGISTLKTTIFVFATVLATIIFAISELLKQYKHGNKSVKIKLNIYEILLLIYALLTIISSIVSEYSMEHIIWGQASRGEGLMTMLCYFTTFIIFEKNFKYSEKFFEYMTGAVTIVSAWGVIQTIIPQYINFSFINKDLINAKFAVGNMGNPNFFSSYLLIFLPILIMKYLKGKDICYLLATAVTFMAFVCARTLSGYLVFAIVLIVLFIIAYRYIADKAQALKRIGLVFLTLIVSIFIITTINGNSYIDELKGIKTNIKQVGTNNFGSNRGLAWKIAIKVIRDYPVFGTGLETFGLKTACNYDYYYEEYKGGGYYFDKAHNEYLHIGAVTGIPSLITYLCFLMSLGINLINRYKKILKNKENDTESLLCIMAALSIFSYLFQAGANISMTFVAPIFWAIMGIGANLCIKNKQIILTNKKTML